MLSKTRMLCRPYFPERGVCLCPTTQLPSFPIKTQINTQIKTQIKTQTKQNNLETYDTILENTLNVKLKNMFIEHINLTQNNAIEKMLNMKLKTVFSKCMYDEITKQKNIL